MNLEQAHIGVSHLAHGDLPSGHLCILCSVILLLVDTRPREVHLSRQHVTRASWYYSTSPHWGALRE